MYFVACACIGICPFQNRLKSCTKLIQLFLFYFLIIVYFPKYLYPKLTDKKGLKGKGLIGGPIIIMRSMASCFQRESIATQSCQHAQFTQSHRKNKQKVKRTDFKDISEKKQKLEQTQCLSTEWRGWISMQWNITWH